jgi:uncharacterized membrane protein
MASATPETRDRDPVGYERTVAFSDGVFAIAITLLVLGIDVPDVPGARLGAAIEHILPNLLSYFIGFAVIGVFWLGHHRFFTDLRAFDRRILLLNLVYLSLIGVMPFTTGLLGDYGDWPLAVAVYALNVAAASLVDAAMAVLALRAGLLEAGPAERRSLLGRSALVPAVFLISIPIAYADADAAKWSWLALVVLPRLLRRTGLLQD